MNQLFISVASAAWIISAWSIPGASAAGLSWDVCSNDQSGKKVCKSRIPHSARVAIAIGCLVVLILLLVLVACIIRNRRAAATSNDEYNVEASQVDGPPTIVDTAYHPRSGPSAVYSAGGGRTPPEMSGPSFPVAAQLPYNVGNDYGRGHTAPAFRKEFPEQEPPKYSYPFTGHGPNNQNHGFSAPRTPGGASYPRPLLTGNRLKDRLKERPASASSLVVSPRA